MGFPFWSCGSWLAKLADQGGGVKWQKRVSLCGMLFRSFLMS